MHKIHGSDRFPAMPESAKLYDALAEQGLDLGVRQTEIFLTGKEVSLSFNETRRQCQITLPIVGLNGSMGHYFSNSDGLAEILSSRNDIAPKLKSQLMQAIDSFYETTQREDVNDLETPGS